MMLFTLCQDGKVQKDGRELLTEWHGQPDS